VLGTAVFSLVFTWWSVPLDELGSRLGTANFGQRGITVDSGSSEADRIACINRLGVHDVVQMHPADHFWLLQACESAIFLALATALVVGCVWWLRHRTA
jgi:hypothetical protein